MNDPTLDLVTTLFRLGRIPEEIARRINKPVGWVNQVINDKEMQERIGDDPVEPLEDDGTEIWSGDAKRFHQERLVPLCFKVWEQTMNDPEASYASKLKAAESVMKYDMSLIDTTKGGEEKVTRIQFSDDQLALLARLQKEAKEEWI